MISYQQLYIDGGWVDSSSQQHTLVIDPATEQPMARVISGNRKMWIGPLKPQKMP